MPARTAKAKLKRKLRRRKAKMVLVAVGLELPSIALQVYTITTKLATNWMMPVIV